MSGWLFIMTADWMPTFAQLSEAKRKFGQWPKESSPIVSVTLLVICIAVLAVVAWVLAKRMIEMARRPGPDLALFSELSDAHALTRADRKMLRRLAGRESLDDPARVFVETKHLESYAKSNTDAAYRRLFEKLFAEQGPVSA